MLCYKNKPKQVNVYSTAFCFTPLVYKKQAKKHQSWSQVLQLWCIYNENLGAVFLEDDTQIHLNCHY